MGIVDPYTDEPYSRDPRQVAAKAEAYLKSTGLADTAYFGPEAEVLEFFLCGQSSLCRLSGERWSSHLECIGTGVSGRSKNGP